MAVTPPRPETLPQYIEWFGTTFKVDLNQPKYQRIYEVNLTAALNAVQASPFFSALPNKLQEWDKEHQRLRGAPLLRNFAESPVLQGKPYKSVLDKSFRRNILWNRFFPDPPRRGGWVTPTNWYASLHDVVRTIIVCRFLDGPDFLASKLVEFAKSLELAARSYTQEREEGYYAFHFNASFSVELTNEDWQAVTQTVDLEVQITTQLQDVLRDLTHPFYERTRLLPPDRGKWKWEHGTNRFRAGYLSHTLHLLEAILVDLRNDSMAGEEPKSDE